MKTNTNTTVKIGFCRYSNIMGITCYMNSILHILQQIPAFMDYICNIKFKDIIIDKLKGSDKMQDYVITNLYILFKNSIKHDDGIITPLSFKTCIGKKNDMWNEDNHQDSQEFFNFLISTLEEEVGIKAHYIAGLNYDDMISDISLDDSLCCIQETVSWTSFQIREYSLFKNMFDGFFENTQKCAYCNAKNSSFEPFLTLGLPIPIKTKKDLSKSYNILECIEQLTHEEQLDLDNMITCDMCGLKTKAFNKTQLWKTPKILVFHIKRFLINNYGVAAHKITNNINYPIKNLDLERFFNPASPHKASSKYDLIGVNLHQEFGNKKNINAGHYTSIVKNMINNKWYLYNDSNPLEKITTRDKIQSSNAYMLFYYRHD